jgi:hypothetical protein
LTWPLECWSYKLAYSNDEEVPGKRKRFGVHLAGKITFEDLAIGVSE